MKKRRPALPLLPLIAIPALLLALAGLYLARLGPAPTPRLPALTLIDSAGQPMSLAALPGRLRLVYFGYTNCPDICPTTLATLTRAIAALGPAGRAITPVFITIDPARDSPAVLARYVRAFSPRPVALTGPPAILARAERAYGIAVTPEGGTINHTAIMLLLDRHNTLLAALPVTLGVPALVKTLKAYLG